MSAGELPAALNRRCKEERLATPAELILPQSPIGNGASGELWSALIQFLNRYEIA